MLDIGWSEMAVILLVALVVIGPKDLPRVARQIGRWSGKARSMAREFQRSLDDMAREAELSDIKAEIDKVSRADLHDEIRKTIDPDRSLERSLDVREQLSLPPRPFDSTASPPSPPAPIPPAVSRSGEASLPTATPAAESAPATNKQS